MKDTLKFRFDKTEFFVNEEKRTVVCKIQGILTGFTGEVENEMVAYAPQTDMHLFDHAARMTFVAKAKCNPGDTWDERTGRCIAESRAKMKAYAFMQQVAQRARDEYVRMAACCDTCSEKYLGILSVEAGRVEKLMQD